MHGGVRAPAFALCAAFVLGLVVAPDWPAAAPLTAAALSLLAGGVSLCGGRPRWATLLLLSGFGFLGTATMSVDVRNRPRDRLENLKARVGQPLFRGPVLVAGTLRREPAFVGDALRLTVDLSELRVYGERYSVDFGLRVRVAGRFTARLRSLFAGDRVSLWATLREPVSLGNPGRLDYARYLERDGTVLLGSTKSALLVERLRSLRSIRSSVSRLRTAAVGRIEDALHRTSEPSVAAGVVVALVTGDRTGLSSELESLYRRAGIFHVMAISGAHVAVWILFVQAVLRRLGASRRASFFVLLVALPFYALFCGSRVPVIRAALMAACVIFGHLLDTGSRALNVVGLAALAVLSARPAYLEDASFQLTFSAMIAIAVLYAPLVRRLSRLSILAPPLAVGCAAQLGVLPVGAWHFHRVHLLAPLSSVPAMLLASAICILGAALVITSCVPAVAYGIAWVLHFAVSALSRFATLVASAPLASMAVARPSFLVIALYCAFVLLWVLPRNRYRPAIAFVIAVSLGASMLPRRQHRDVLTMTVLDVGHGDAIVLSLPDGGHVLVDAGGSPRSTMDIGESVVVPFLLDHGVRRLRAAVVSHSDFDHIGGLASVLSWLPVDEVWEGVSDWDRPAYERLRSVALERGVPFRSLRKGESFELGGAVFEVLAAGEMKGASANDRSLVLRVGFAGRAVLLTGDAESALEAVLSTETRSFESDVLKVAHHGSRTSTTAAFLDRVRPLLAVVSTREVRHRPIPAKEVLRRLDARGIKTLRTDRDGAVSLRIHRDGSLQWSTFR